MIILILVVLGLAFGSFTNALVWRLHEQATSKKKRGDKRYSITKGRSMCVHCHHELAAKDLVPVLSWLELRGKCRYCHKPIDDTPLAEIGTAALFVASYIWWPLPFDAHGTFNFIIWLVVLVGFVALLIYDLRWMLLPNRIIYPLIAIAGAAVLVNATVFGGGFTVISQAGLAMSVTAGVFYLLFQLSDGKWIGGGDVKLGIIIGLLLSGLLQGFLVLFIASILGVLAVVPGMITRKVTVTSRIPFGPFLIVAAIIVKLFGASMILWYRHKFLPGY